MTTKGKLARVFRKVSGTSYIENEKFKPKSNITFYKLMTLNYDTKKCGVFFRDIDSKMNYVHTSYEYKDGTLLYH